jgi:hypothetical protein
LLVICESFSLPFFLFLLSCTAFSLVSRPWLQQQQSQRPRDSQEEEQEEEEKREIRDNLILSTLLLIGSTEWVCFSLPLFVSACSPPFLLRCHEIFLSGHPPLPSRSPAPAQQLSIPPQCLSFAYALPARSRRWYIGETRV